MVNEISQSSVSFANLTDGEFAKFLKDGRPEGRRLRLTEWSIGQMQ